MPPSVHDNTASGSIMSPVVHSSESQVPLNYSISSQVGDDAEDMEDVEELAALDAKYKAEKEELQRRRGAKSRRTD